MAIGTNAAIRFWGTPDALATTSSQVLADAFSDGTNDFVAWTNDDDVESAIAIFQFTHASSANSNSGHNLYARPIDTVGTADAEVPDSTFRSQFMGRFFAEDNSTSEQTNKISIALEPWEPSSVFNFYIENGGGQTISAGMELTIIPVAVGPHA